MNDAFGGLALVQLTFVERAFSERGAHSIQPAYGCLASGKRLFLVGEVFNLRIAGVARQPTLQSSEIF